MTTHAGVTSSFPSPGMCRRGEMRQDLQRLERLFEDVQREKELVVARLALRTPGSLTPAALRRATDPGCRQSMPSPSALKSAMRMSENGSGSKYSPQRGGGGRTGVCRSLDGAVGSAGGGSAGRPARASPSSRSASASKELPLSPAGRRSNAARPLFGGGNGAAFSPKKPPASGSTFSPKKQPASSVPFSPNKQLACKSKMGAGAGSDDDVLLGSPVRGATEEPESFLLQSAPRPPSPARPPRSPPRAPPRASPSPTPPAATKPWGPPLTAAAVASPLRHPSQQQQQPKQYGGGVSPAMLRSGAALKAHASSTTPAQAALAKALLGPQPGSSFAASKQQQQQSPQPPGGPSVAVALQPPAAGAPLRPLETSSSLSPAQQPAGLNCFAQRGGSSSSGVAGSWGGGSSVGGGTDSPAKKSSSPLKKLTSLFRLKKRSLSRHSPRAEVDSIMDSSEAPSEVHPLGAAGQQQSGYLAEPPSGAEESEVPSSACTSPTAPRRTASLTALKARRSQSRLPTALSAAGEQPGQQQQQLRGSRQGGGGPFRAAAAGGADGDSDASGSPSSAGPAAPKPFLKRRSVAVVPGKKPDWSGIGSRTQSRLDPNLVPANARCGTLGSDASSGRSTPRAGQHPQPSRFRTPNSAPNPRGRPATAAGGADRGGPYTNPPRSAGGIGGAHDSFSATGAGPHSPDATRGRSASSGPPPPWGGVRCPSDKGPKGQEPHLARTRPFSPTGSPTREAGQQARSGARGRGPQVYEASSLLNSGSSADGGNYGPSASLAGPLDDLLGKVDRMLLQLHAQM